MRSKPLLKGGVVWFRCRGWRMHQNPTYEVIKMKLTIRSCNAEHFHTRARRKSKTLKFYQSVIVKSEQNSKIFNIWRAKTRATLPECVWKYLALQTIIVSFILITSYWVRPKMAMGSKFQKFSKEKFSWIGQIRQKIYKMKNNNMIMIL